MPYKHIIQQDKDIFIETLKEIEKKTMEKKDANFSQ